ncbi:NlpC/P60 family protein [Actinomadura sp. DC4]|uniref:NlpC/P60 family protein n=1 Tax=Actinomadura sp. DC4 TaxID=3055069 RepID=UPI0025B114B3|nr:NlpC/P60 family protein [Actinomadura sp. DC4]MDN3358453.1 NlpC/P60 family protein [Actinomadura sp. DC4]
MRKPVILLSAIAGPAIIALVPVMSRSIVDARAHDKISKSARPLLPGYRYIRSAHPDRTAVYDRHDHLVAQLTEGSSTVVFHGRTRTFTDPDTTSAAVRTDAWVRFAPSPWRFGQQQQAWFRTWFGAKLGGRSPDLFADAVRYLSGRPLDAGFGPPAEDSVHRVRGADWNDYLGVVWAGRQPRTTLSRDVDCSGYIRLLFGHDMGVRLFRDRDPHTDGLGRLSRAMAAAAPGIEIADSRPRQLTDLGLLQPGDLVFFALHDDTRISHMGFFLGVEEQGHDRFVSSRMRANGPTFGDIGGAGILDGHGYYARHLRIIRRL